MRNLILLTVYFLTTCVSYCQPLTLTDVIKKTESSVFIIYTFDKKNELLSQGSGFFVSENGVGITNYHVLEGASTAMIKLKNGEKYPIKKVIDYDEKIDIVKFQIENPENKSIPFLSITKSYPKIGENIFNIGNPLGLEQTVSNGIISSFREIPPHGNLIQITAPISEGSSGSPVFNLKGQVIGIATMGFKRGQNLNFALSYKEIVNLNKNLNKNISDLGKNVLETITYEKAKAEYIEGNLPSALILLKEELNINGTNHLALNLKGRIETDLEDYESAIESLFYAVSLDSTSKDYLNNFGIANAKFGYNNSGDFDSFKTAMIAYRKALEIDRNYEIGYLNKAYLIFNNIFNVEKPSIDTKYIYEALEDLNKAVAINSEYASAYALRASIKFKLKDNWAALEDISKAILIENDNYEFYFTRGEIKCFGINDYPNAIFDFDKALTLTSMVKKQADILGLRCIAKSLYGLKNDACSDAKKAFQLDPNPLYSDLIKDLCK